MFHTVKKTLSRVKEPLLSPPNAEFADYRQRLSSIKISLRYTSNMLTSANRGWIIQMQQQRAFSHRFQHAYPSTHDDIYAVAAQFADGSQALYEKFTREEAGENSHARIQAQVDRYILQIEKVESMYGKLISAKAEMDRYQNKLDALERATRNVDDEKKNRNVTKLDRHKQIYEELLQQVLEKQKHIYAKHPVVFKAALTAYWLNHERHVTLLVNSLRHTQRFAKLHQHQMMTLDIDTYEPDLASFLPIRSIAFSNTSSEARDDDDDDDDDDGRDSACREEDASGRVVKNETPQHTTPVPNIQNDTVNTFESSPTSIAGDMHHVFVPAKKTAAGRTTNSASGGGGSSGGVPAAGGGARVRV